MPLRGGHGQAWKVTSAGGFAPSSDQRNAHTVEPYADVVESYRGFSDYAGSDSPTFREWAASVADDSEVVAWIAKLPEVKQQPNLVFAAARWHGVTAPGPYSGLRDALLADEGPIRSTILARATQANEVGRLATLLPAFSQFRGPLALIEVGASAGLCLYPDRWAMPGQRRRAKSGSVMPPGFPAR